MLFYHASDICQIRLDFFKTILMQPQSSGSVFGICSDTVLKVTGGTTSNSIINKPPDLCGILTDQHGKFSHYRVLFFYKDLLLWRKRSIEIFISFLFIVYIDSGRASTAATLAFTFGSAGSGSANVWRVSWWTSI